MKKIYEVSIEKGTKNDSTTVESFIFEDLESANEKFDNEARRLGSGHCLYLLESDSAGETWCDTLKFKQN